MPRFTGTGRNDIITPALVTSGVTRWLAGTLPSDLDDSLSGGEGGDTLRAANLSPRRVDTLDGDRQADRVILPAGAPAPGVGGVLP